MKEEKPYTYIKHGRYIHQINAARFTTAAHFVRQGIIVVSDELLWTEQDVIALIQGLANINVYLIGVSIENSAGAKREQQRFLEENPTCIPSGFRPDGMSLASAGCVHRYMNYDLEIDNTCTTPQDSALKIAHYIQRNPKPQAFLQLSKKYNP